MTPFEKAAELITNYQITVTSLNYDDAKKCALIAVNELMRSMAVQQCNEDFYWKKVKGFIKNS